MSKKCLCHIPCDLVSTLTNRISKKYLLKICLPHPYNRSFSIISLIMHDHDVIFIPKFQNSFTLSSWVLISNLVFVATHLLWFSKFGLISLIMHDYDVIISHHHKKVLVSRSLQYHGHITKKIGPKNSLLKICTLHALIRSTICI